MNSDPHDSTAWRSFGMLDTDESAGFDEAMRHDPQLKASVREMDRISAAVALATSHPVTPREGHLERIQARLGLQRPRQAPLWFGLSGWAAAAALAMLLAWNVDGIRVVPARPAPTVHAPADPARKHPETRPADPSATPADDGEEDAAIATTTKPTGDENRSGLVLRQETEQLTLEIAALQDQLHSYQQRERTWSQILPGVALPVIMKMTPPGMQAVIDPSLAQNDSPISQLLGETLRITNSPKTEAGDAPDVEASKATTSDIAALTTTDQAPALAPPGAIPIYDAARDAGTLVVTNLPPAAEGQECNLWVQTTREGPPVRLGVLPDAGTSPSESFDFTLGSKQVRPSGFILTQDPKDKPAAPHSRNTVLQSPQTPEP